MFRQTRAPWVVTTMKAIGSARKGDRRCFNYWERLRSVTTVTLICIENGCLRYWYDELGTTTRHTHRRFKITLPNTGYAHEKYHK